MQHDENPSEELFARLCTSKYSAASCIKTRSLPRAQAEAGDVVVWVRDWLVILG